MNYKEKAQELVSMFLPFVATDNKWDTEYLQKRNNAKQCALIVVNQILKQLTPIEKAPNNKDAFECWQQVKEEIEKL
jgi:hypothetical protein